MAKLKTEFSVTDFDVFKDVTNILHDVINDKSIDMTVRTKYKQKIDKVLNPRHYCMEIRDGDADGQEE